MADKQQPNKKKSSRVSFNPFSRGASSGRDRGNDEEEAQSVTTGVRTMSLQQGQAAAASAAAGTAQQPPSYDELLLMLQQKDRALQQKDRALEQKEGENKRLREDNARDKVKLGDCLKHPLLREPEPDQQRSKTKESRGSTDAGRFMDLLEASINIERWDTNDFFSFLATRGATFKVTDVPVYERAVETLMNSTIAGLLQGYPSHVNDQRHEVVLDDNISKYVQFPLAEGLKIVNGVLAQEVAGFKLVFEGQADAEFLRIPEDWPERIPSIPTPNSSFKIDRHWFIKCSESNPVNMRQLDAIVEIKRDMVAPTYDESAATEAARTGVSVNEVKKTRTSERIRKYRELMAQENEYLKNLADYIGSLGYDERHCPVRQVFTYMALHSCVYGIITTHERWSFLRFVPETKTLLIAGQFSGRRDSPVVAGGRSYFLYEIILLFMLSAYESKCDYSILEKYVDFLGDHEKEKQDKKEEQAKRRGRGSGPSKSDKAGTQSSSGDGSTASGAAASDQADSADDTLMDSNDPHWHGHVSCAEFLRRGDPYAPAKPDDPVFLGVWKTGAVWRKTIGGKDMVVKQLCFRDYGGERARGQIRHEHAVYRHLASLQSEVIPKLYFAGNMMKGWTDGIATSYEGEALNDDTVISATFMEKALQGLDRIHALGVLHGDIALRNILWRKSDDAPVFIDFERSSFSVDETPMRMERDTLAKQLKCLLEDPMPPTNVEKLVSSGEEASSSEHEPADISEQEAAIVSSKQLQPSRKRRKEHRSNTLSAT